MKNLYFALSVFLFFSCNEEGQSTAQSNDKKSPNTTVVENSSDNTIEAEPSTETVQVKTENGEVKTVTIDKRGNPLKDQNSIKTDINLPSNQEVNTKAEETKMIVADFSGVYNDILKNFVSSSGKVNYAAIKTTRPMLSQATQYFEENPPQSSWSKNQKLAYWINAYNLYTIELIVDNYPVKSIKDIAGGKPWDKKFIKLDGRNLSLNDIENGIIRKDFNEPRIHFAVNCASISCPKLLNKAYTASNLNSLLESQTKRFINDNSMNSITATNPEISNIFDWYKVDFGNVISFLNKYSNTPIESSAKISYKDYNWNLNN